MNTRKARGQQMNKNLVMFLRPSKRTILLIFIVITVTIIISTTVSILLERTIKLHVPSFGTLKTLGVEAYWDKNCEDKTETINWGTIWPGSSQKVTFYMRSISNVEATLYLSATNWNPANISEYMNLVWNYNETTINPGEIIQVTLTLSASSSDSFILYLITNNVKEFSFDIIIGTSEYIG